MSDKYKGIYRTQSFRLLNWDYSSEGTYFITICTQNKEQFFGEIEDNVMKLSILGELAEKYWLEIPNQFSFVHLGQFVVMPNHLHGLLIIRKFDYNLNKENNEEDINGGFSGIKNPMFHQNISRVIRWYKGRCSFEIRKINADFKWQKLFHDQIIRDSNSFLNHRKYIIDNPANWEEDSFNV